MNFSIKTIPLFIGIMLGGETFLVPAIYFSFLDYISFTKVAVIGVTANVVADTAWYFFGRYAPVEKIKDKFFFKKYTKQIEKAGDVFKENGLYFLFTSKFVFGTRTVMQILCGLNKIPIFQFMTINILGILSYMGILFGMSYFFRESLKIFKLSVTVFQVGFAALFILIIIGFIWFSKRMKHKWFRS